MEKVCSNCERPTPAQFSLVVIVSSVGVSKRLQESSRSVLFCSDCLHELVDRLCSDALSQCVNSALTQLKMRLNERVNASA
jgi:hypothetical protein